MNVEREFKTVKTQLTELSALKDQVTQQGDALAAYEKANAALRAQIEALEASGTGLGSVSGDARAAAGELALQTSNSAILLESLRQREESMRGVIDTLEQRVEELEGQLAVKVEEATKLHRSRMEIVLEASKRAVDQVSDLKERVREADKIAVDALGKAENSKAMTKDQFTKADVLAMVQSEIRVSAEQIVELVIDSLKPQFPHGFAGPRMDAEYVEQTGKDRANTNEIRYGLDQAFKAVLKRSGSA